jgi:hypothetical protein
MVSQQSAHSDGERREEAAAAARCPAASRRGSEPGKGDQEEPLNEVRPITELAAVRMLLTERGDSEE